MEAPSPDNASFDPPVATDMWGEEDAVSDRGSYQQYRRLEQKGHFPRYENLCDVPILRPVRVSKTLLTAYVLFFGYMRTQVQGISHRMSARIDSDDTRGENQLKYRLQLRKKKVVCQN